jgi:hypothetical protein
MAGFFDNIFAFDYGKSLLKQLEQLRKLPLAQQQKREQALVKDYEKFVQRYMEKVTSSSNTQPALLKAGAEALVEAAVQLREPRLAYMGYAEMVARSRKVPVVPGLAALVDRLLELPTEQKEERIALLNWRIVTGSMKPERQLAYLAERAELTGAVSDWKDYSWNISQLISKGTLAPNDPIILDALNNLLKNKGKLGDRLGAVQMLMAEAQLAQGKYRQAEIQLTDLATEAKQLPDRFLGLVGDLVAKYPETNWMLQHQLLAPTVTALLDGKLNWTNAVERLDRARGHTTQLIEFLLSHERLTEDDRLGIYCLERICSLEKNEADPLYDRWRDVYKEAGREQPAGTAEVVEKAVIGGHLTKRDVAKVASIELGPSLLACEERGDVARVLNTNVPTETLSAGRVDEINSELANPNISDWVVEETRLWLAEHLSRLGRLDSAARQLTSIPVLNEKHAAQLYPRIANMFAGSTPPPQIQSLLARMSLLGGDYHGAFAAAQQLPADNPARGQLLSALEEWILAQIDAPADMLLVLAQTQRLSHGDPAAGLQAATTASLLAPDSEAVQQAYRSWEHALAPELIYAQRAHQAAYIAEQQRRLELIPVALDSIEMLETARGDDVSRESLALLEQLRPLLLSVPLDQQEQTNLRWARLYLMVQFKQGEGENLSFALQEVSTMVPQDKLFSLLGEFAGKLPPNTRLQVEYEPLVRGGQWERALELCQASSGELISSLVSIPLFCEYVPTSALPEASRRFAAVLDNRGDDAGQLLLIQRMQDRLARDSELPQAEELREVLAGLLEALCKQPYEPAIRYRLDSLRASGDLESVAGEILALAKTGDDEALTDVRKLFEQSLAAGKDPERIKDMALTLAADALEEDPKIAVDYLTRAGRAIHDAQWAVNAISELELNTETAEGLALIGELALQQGDLGRASVVMQRLTELGALDQAQALADALALAQPDSPTAMQSLILMQLNAQPRDMTTALENLHKLIAMYQAEGTDMATALQPISSAAEQAIGYDTDLPSLEFRIALALLRGDQFKVDSLIQEVARHGPEAASAVLDLLRQLGLKEDDLPGGLVVSWSRALFVSGDVEGALAKLATLRDAVEDYPEYISLLEEIKDRVGGPGPSLQLAEAYLRVHLWQRSAEEYGIALLHDPTVGEAVLQQLREHAALAPNPMKYPLHVAGLAATAHSSRYADWGWAISALSWLVPRWEPRELYDLARGLWDNVAAMPELQPEERVQLLVELFQLAVKLQDYSAALDYLTIAWEQSPLPSPELQEALASFDRGRLPSDPAVQEKLLRFELQSALATGDAEKVFAAAHRLSELSASGKEAAAVALSQFQANTDNPVLVLLQRMRMLDIHNAQQRSGFLAELAGLAVPGIAEDQLKLIVNTLLALLRQLPDDAELQMLLLRLLRQYGDQARAWQLALAGAYGTGPLAEAALAELDQAADDEYSHGTREALAEVWLARGETEAAAQTLLRIPVETAGPEAAAIAEALLDSPQAAAVRIWLVAYYRGQGQDVLAADHTVWAQRAGANLDSSWIAKSSSGELLLRAAQLAEQRGDSIEKDLLTRALADAGLPRHAQAAAAFRLAGLAEAAGEIETALTQLEAAAATGVDLPGVAEQRARIEQARRERLLGELRARPDTEERTLDLAHLLIELGDLPGAITELQGAIARGQASAELSLELAEAFTANGDYNLGRRAYTDLRRKLEAADNAPPELKLRACYGLATAEEALGNLDGAISALEDILVLSASFRDTRERLNGLYAAKRGTAPTAPEPRPRPPAQTPASEPAAAAAGGKDQILDEILALLDLPDEGEGPA